MYSKRTYRSYARVESRVHRVEHGEHQQQQRPKRRQHPGSNNAANAVQCRPRSYLRARERVRHAKSVLMDPGEEAGGRAAEPSARLDQNSNCTAGSARARPFSHTAIRM